jgi:glycosyltransferase involved in cell wall biosynthesis
LAALEQNLNDHLHFHVIGFAEGDQALKSDFAARLGKHATLENRVRIEELPERLAQADVLLIPRTRHPAMHGGLPSKFAEYLAMGRPLIVTNVDETAKFVSEHQCGLVCEPNVDSMSAAIRQAAAWSAEERQTMGQNARKLAETVFDWKVIALDYLKALQATNRKGGDA